MSELSVGTSLDVLTGLGNGYDITKSTKPLLIGGGVGVPPMYNLAKTLISSGQKPVVVLGFNTQDEVFYEDEFKALGCETFVTTVDGSYGIKGFVTDAIKNVEYDYFYTCGPLPMFKAIYNATQVSGQFSFEERMGCGFGACMGCSCKTKYGNKRICKDGPVLVKEEIIW
jgi:dihydroorotate dehydrogenase electron transfer subunit